MRLNLNDLLYTPGAALPFDFQMDGSDLEWNGELIAPHPIHVTGFVRNRAGALVLECEATTPLALICDRCLKPFSKELSICLDTLLANELENGENDDILLLDHGELALGDYVRESLILGIESKHLCSEACKGFCDKCGANLNERPCGCKPDMDPRLAALAQLLEDR